MICWNMKLMIMNDDELCWRIFYEIFILLIFFLLFLFSCCCQTKGVPDLWFKTFTEWTCKKTMHDLKHPVCMHATWPAIRLGICNYSVGQVSPTMSRRVILVRLWRCQGPGSLGRQRRSSEMKSLGLWPHLMPHSNVCILHKNIFGSERIGAEISYLFTANLSIIFSSLDILRCLETPILWNEMK